MVVTYREFELDDERSRLDFPVVQSWLAGSYWSPDIALESVLHAARHSALIVGAYTGEAQAGYLRVVSDCSRFAYLCDVWVDEPHRGRGLARAMVRYALDHEDFRTVTRWLLATRDAHGVYKEVGFEALKSPDRWLIIERSPVT